MNMTAAELKAIRKRLGLSVTAFAQALGYQGNRNTLTTTVRRYEMPGNGRPIPPWIARLAVMFDRHGVPEEWLPPEDRTDLDAME